MIQFIALAILVISLFVVIFILYKKFPVLSELPENGHHGIRKPKLISEIEKTVKENYNHFIKNQALSHKFFSKLWVWTLKFERKIQDNLQKIRKKSQKTAKGTRRKKK